MAHLIALESFPTVPGPAFPVWASLRDYGRVFEANYKVQQAAQAIWPKARVTLQERFDPEWPTDATRTFLVVVDVPCVDGSRKVVGKAEVQGLNPAVLCAATRWAIRSAIRVPDGIAEGAIDLP